MRNLAEIIEAYFLRLLSASPHRYIDFCRKEVAEKFNCVPSQINYVLETRFTLEKGFFVESRRGGGGYLRISKVDIARNKPLLDAISLELGDKISQKSAEDFIDRLVLEMVISRREGCLLKVAVGERYFPEKNREALRADFLKEALKAVIKNS